MKYYFLILLLLPLHCLSQHAAVAAAKMNVLYIGVPNPVSFAVENTKCSELKMVVENGSAKRTGECEYTVEVTKQGNAFIFLTKGKDTIYRTMYRVKNIPNPVTNCWGNDGPYWFLLDSLRKQNGLSATMNQFEFDARFSISSFLVTVIRNKKLDAKKTIYCTECLKKIEGDHYETVFSTVNEGADFNDKWKAFIQNELAPGDKVFIEEINALGPDNKIRQLVPISFTVQ